LPERHIVLPQSTLAEFTANLIKSIPFLGIQRAELVEKCIELLRLEILEKAIHFVIGGDIHNSSQINTV
jgi:hypothetical protein